jgi:hypothetical protein
MRARFNPSFKSQAVEKALSRSEGISLAEIPNAGSGFEREYIYCEKGGF